MEREEKQKPIYECSGVMNKPQKSKPKQHRYLDVENDPFQHSPANLVKCHHPPALPPQKSCSAVPYPYCTAHEVQGTFFRTIERGLAATAWPFEVPSIPASGEQVLVELDSSTPTHVSGSTA